MHPNSSESKTIFQKRSGTVLLAMRDEYKYEDFEALCGSTPLEHEGRTVQLNRK